ncbi:acetylornithine transaminase [Kocuria sp.]|uniref:acetylornithine transaminase n=1 Tax=Kocuria sp. TaxID=1871328 RepID=UPI0026DFF0C9|nr:acetylornithine transaminase [Kocuria sp.]MDO5618704.1 acetylornithine transaminase [Kocuria sp.]
MSAVPANTAPALTQEQLLDRYKSHLLNVFGTPQAVLVRGEGSRVWDADGEELLDLLGGIAVNVLGHAHPAWSRAVSEQAQTLSHVSNFFTSPQQIELADRLLGIAGAPHGSHVFFANSGAEANEAAFKLARRNGRHNPGPDGPRTKVVAVNGSFHGRTMGALALTAKKAYREPFEPLPGGVIHIDPTLEALEAVMDATVSAVIVEPIRGEQGVHVLPEGWLQRARELTREHAALLIVDEVQTGIGRTGEWLAAPAQLNPGELPDAITLAKGLGGGFPIGAMITVGQEVSDLLTPGQHGTTFGGNPLATAAGLATLNVIQDEDLMTNVRSVSKVLADGLNGLEDVQEVRDHGFLIGADLSDQRPESEQARSPLGAAVVAAARSQGFIINSTGAATLRLAPALNLSQDQAEAFVNALPGIITQARQAAEQA